jgi:hypothetical protein
MELRGGSAGKRRLRDRKSWPRYSAGRANENDYMGDVARVHADMLRKADSKKK